MSTKHPPSWPSPPTRFKAGRAALFVGVLVLAAYLPTTWAGYVWDDDVYLTANENLRSLDGLRRIWAESAASVQYYPLVFTSFWIEYHLWGLHATGYHVVNVLLHGLVAWLLWRVLVRLDVPLAGWAAAIFALHPVQVESVAWITERKNVLSGVFYMAALYVHVKRRDRQDEAKISLQREDGVILLLYLAALLAKTATCSLPVAMLIIDWWRGRAMGWRAFARVAPMFLLGLALGGLTLYMERTHVGTEHLAMDLSWAERCILAGRAFWFYLGKIFWPVPVMFTYSRWEVDGAKAMQFVWPVAAVVLGAALWLGRGRWGRGPLAAMLFFVATLGPVLGFLDVFIFRYSFVADHFVYLASIGPIAWGCGMWDVGCRTYKRHIQYPTSHIRHLWGGGVLVVLAALSFQHALVFFDEQTLWTDTIGKNPRAWGAHVNLGVVLERQGKYAEALEHFEKADALSPNQPVIAVNLGAVLFRVGRTEEALARYHAAIGQRPNFWFAHYSLGTVLRALDRKAEAAASFGKALELKPDSAQAAYDLGALAEETGRDEEAIGYFERALSLQGDLSWAHYHLGVLHERRGEKKKALDHVRRFLEANPSQPEARALLGRMEGK